MKKQRIQKNKGFSLIEFIVILTIFAIMTSVSLFNYNGHQSVIEQSNIADDVALSIRQAQVYGISATDRSFGGSEDSGDFDAGSYLDTAGSSEAVNIINDKSVRGFSVDLDTGEMVLFEDNRSRRNKIYNPGSGTYDDRIIDKRAIKTNRVAFDRVVLCDSAGDCSSRNTGIVDIAFERPYPDAIISYRERIGSGTAPSFAKALLVLTNVDDEESNSYVEVTAIGSIAVKRNYDENN